MPSLRFHVLYRVPRIRVWATIVSARTYAISLFTIPFPCNISTYPSYFSSLDLVSESIVYYDFHARILLVNEIIVFLFFARPSVNRSKLTPTAGTRLVAVSVSPPQTASSLIFPGFRSLSSSSVRIRTGPRHRECSGLGPSLLLSNPCGIPSAISAWHTCHIGHIVSQHSPAHQRLHSRTHSLPAVSFAFAHPRLSSPWTAVDANPFANGSS
ncbi:hypothetical protein EDB86DRAFT_63040 [Lactarius hatsudake]|nr:hypothetical protein EDB86DRAFT_63040 [Lactarius hatsudake]